MMRRILVLVTVALVMAAMMLAMAMPAFANHSDGHTLAETLKSSTKSCQANQGRPGASDCPWTGAVTEAQGPK
jgi:Tfp pilus assembly protein FimT